MQLSHWKTLEPSEKRIAIAKYGIGLNYKGIIESFDYFNAVVDLTLYLKETEKRTRYGMAAVRERLRWDSKLEDGSVLFKINNNLTPDINRLMVKMFPELIGFYEVRKEC